MKLKNMRNRIRTYNKKKMLLKLNPYLKVIKIQKINYFIRNNNKYNNFKFLILNDIIFNNIIKEFNYMLKKK